MVMLGMIKLPHCKKILSSYGLPRRLSSLPEQKPKASRFCGNLHLRDDRKSFTISAAKAAWPAGAALPFSFWEGKKMKEMKTTAQWLVDCLEAEALM